MGESALRTGGKCAGGTRPATGANSTCSKGTTTANGNRITAGIGDERDHDHDTIAIATTTTTATAIATEGRSLLQTTVARGSAARRILPAALSFVSQSLRTPRPARLSDPDGRQSANSLDQARSPRPSSGRRSSLRRSCEISRRSPRPAPRPRRRSGARTPPRRGRRLPAGSCPRVPPARRAGRRGAPRRASSPSRRREEPGAHQRMPISVPPARSANRTTDDGRRSARP